MPRGQQQRNRQLARSKPLDKAQELRLDGRFGPIRLPLWSAALEIASTWGTLKSCPAQSNIHMFIFRRLMYAAVLSALAAAVGGINLSWSGVREYIPAAAPGDTVVVQQVLDGDTVIVQGVRERVRLANIDAPEASHGYGKPGQPYSLQSTKWLAAQLERKPGVTIKCVDQDRYGRMVCDFYRNGEHVNKDAVRHGMAWANTANPRYLRDKSVLTAQNEAKSAGRGLWSQPDPTPPWQWRNDCWREGACASVQPAGEARKRGY